MKLEDMVLFSVDDHIIEPPDMFDSRMPAKFADGWPKHHHAENGDDFWSFEGRILKYMGSNAVVGRPREEYGFEPSSLSQMRPGCYDVHARIGDMNANGIACSINFGSMSGFCGETFMQAKDKALGLAALQAWNDWHIEDWAGAYPGRLAPMAILPLWDPQLAAAEVRRVKAKGCNVISFHPNPIMLGLPSFHTDYWDPIWQVCVDEEITICLHFADGSYSVPSPDSPVDVMISNMPIGLYRVASDLVYSPVLRKFPAIQFAMSESGAGWVPYMKQRIDCVFRLHSQWTRQDFDGKRPSEIFDRNFATSFIDDPVGVLLRHEVGIQNMTWEVDYPHADCTWPQSPETLWRDLVAANVPDDEIEIMTHRNAIRLFKLDPFKHFKREEITVGALRQKAKEMGVDTSPMKTDGAGRPPSESDRGPVSMRDMAKQIAEAGGGAAGAAAGRPDETIMVTQ